MHHSGGLPAESRVQDERPRERDETRHPAAGAGLALGLAGVVVFGLTLPATRLAVAHLDTSAVAFGRALLGGLLATLAMRHALAGHGGVVLGVLPLAAAVTAMVAMGWRARVVHSYSLD